MAHLDVSENKPLMDALMAVAKQPKPFAKDQPVVALWSEEDDGEEPQGPPEDDGEEPQGPRDKEAYPGIITVVKLDRTGGQRHKYDVHYLDDGKERMGLSHGAIFTAQEHIVCAPDTVIPGTLIVSGIYPPDSEEENWLADRRHIFIDLPSKKVYSEFAPCLATQDRGIYIYKDDNRWKRINSFSEYELVLADYTFNNSWHCNADEEEAEEAEEVEEEDEDGNEEMDDEYNIIVSNDEVESEAQSEEGGKRVAKRHRLQE